MSKGINYGEMGILLSSGKVWIAPGTPKSIKDWDTALLAYASYKLENGMPITELFDEWGTPHRHIDWFKDAVSRFRVMNSVGGIA